MRAGVPAAWGAAAAVAALALTGCETTAEKSARLEGEAKHITLARSGLSIGHPSRVVKVLRASLLRSSEGAAAVITLQNTSSRALEAVPLAISVRDRSGRVLYANNTPGLEAGLVSVPSIAPHAQISWVDDQLPSPRGPATVSARAGESESSPSAPAMSVAGLRLSEDPVNGLGAAGTVTNNSATAQRKLVVFVLARRGGTIVAAGRSVLPELAAGASAPFQVFFVGDPRNARLSASAPADTFP